MWVPRGSSTEITELVTISKVKWIEKNTATSFLLLLFFSGKRKVNAITLSLPKCAAMGKSKINHFLSHWAKSKWKSKIGRKFTRQSHQSSHNVSKGQALRVLIIKWKFHYYSWFYPTNGYWLMTNNFRSTFFPKTLTAFHLPLVEMAFFFFFFFLLN